MNAQIDLVKTMSNVDSGHFGGNIKPHTVNASTLHNLCPRQHFYANQHKDQHLCTELKGSALQITFDIGNALEHTFREKFIEQHGITRVVGNWVIRDDIPVQNPNNVSKQWSHKHKRFEECELRFGDPLNTLDDFREVRIGGAVTRRIDWIFLDYDNYLRVVELKSISKTKFLKKKGDKLDNSEVKLKKPLPEHIIQGLSYVRGCHEFEPIKSLGYPIRYGCDIFYTLKEFRNRNADEKIKKLNPMYRSFYVDYNDHKKVMKDRWEAAEAAVEASKTGILPDRTVCSTYLRGRAKQCEFVCRCFMED